MSNITPFRAATPLRPRDYNAHQLDLIKRTVAKDCNNDEFNLFVEVCRRVGLDPFRRQIYANVYNKDKPDKRQVVFITGIDGFRAIAARNGNYRPDENEPEVTIDEAKADPKTNPRGIVKAAVTVHQQDANGIWHPLKGVAYWDEFAPVQEIVRWEDTGEVYQDSGKPKRRAVPTGEFELPNDPGTKFWRKMPHLMLAKCAEAQALRRGWPEDLSGLYAPEEMHQADVDEAMASEIVARHHEEQRLIQTRVANTIPMLWHAGEALEAVPLGHVADRCMAFIKASESPTELEAWRERNRIGLQEFWARQKADALEVKRALELRIERLSQTGLEGG